MATVQKIYEEMQRMAPLELAESWDNPGLLVDCGGEVSRVLVALDVTAETLAEAEQNGCQLIVTHHPVIFHPLKKLSPADLPSAPWHGPRSSAPPVRPGTRAPAA